MIRPAPLLCRDGRHAITRGWGSGCGGDLWTGLTRLQEETERFALDKRQAIVAGLGMLSGKT
jgi:hypothetical protein